MLNLDIPTLNLVLGVIIPLLVGVVTKLRASAGLKAVVNAGLSALAGAVAAAITASGAVHLKTVIIGILTTWGISLLTYYGLFKPTGITASIQNATADLGIGTPTTLQTRAKPVTLAGALVTLNVDSQTYTQTFASGDRDMPAFGELADADDQLDGCAVDMAAEAIEPGTEALWALSPDGDPTKLEEYGVLFNQPATPEGEPGT